MKAPTGKICSLFLLAGVTAFICFFQAAVGQVVISEIMYHPSGDGDAEFLEIFNNSNNAVSVGGWCLEGINFCFEAASTLEGGRYFVLASDRQAFSSTYGFDPDAVYSGRLDNAGEWIRILESAGGLVDEVRYDDKNGWPVTPDGTGPSLEVIDPSQDNSIPRNWRAAISTSGHSAGRVNSVNQIGMPPWIDPKDLQPVEIRPGAPFLVAVPVIDAELVHLKYRINFEWEKSLVMSDNGTGSDTIAGDGIFSAEIPGQPVGTLIRYRIVAQSGNGQMHYPRTDDTVHYDGYVVRSDFSSDLPVFQWFIDENSYNRALEHRYNDETEPAVFYYNGKVYDNVRVRVRGGSARWWPKLHWKFIFPVGHSFEAPDFLPNSVDRINLQSSYGDKTFLREILSYQSFADAGVPSCVSFPVRLHRNGEFFGLYIFLEQPDENWLERVGLDEDGALYKAFGAAELPDSMDLLQENYEKKTREEESYQDLFDLLTGVNTLAGKELEEFLFDNLDIPEVMNYLAVQAIIHNNDHVAKNYYLYRDTGGTDRWKILPWDMDLTFGRNYLGEPSAEWGLVLNDTLWADVDLIPERPEVSPSHPLFGDSKHQKWDYLWNRLIDSVYRVPDLRQMYFRRLRTLIDQQLSNDRFEKRLNELSPLIQQEAQQDSNLWPQYGKYQTQAEAVQFLKEDYLAPRRIHLMETHRIAGEIPASQSTDAAVVINEIMVKSGSDDKAGFVELFNPSWTESIDLSNWTLEGAGLSVAPGTVILPRDFVVFVKDDQAFREKYGSGLFIGGEFPGKLSDSGEKLVLRDPNQRIVDEVEYLSSDEWPMLEDGKSFELANPEADNSLSVYWGVSLASNGTPGRNNSLSTVPAFRFHIPIWETVSQRYTGIAVSNPVPGGSRIRFSAHGNDGALSNLPLNPSPFALNPWNQLALLGPEIFGAAPFGGEDTHIVLENFDNPSGSFFMYGNLRQLDGAISQVPVSDLIFFPRVAAEIAGKKADVKIGIVNPNSEDIEVVMALKDRAGSILGSEERRIPAQGCLIENAAILFPGAILSPYGYVEAKSANGEYILGSEIIDLDNGKSLIVLNAEVPNPEIETFSAQLAAGPGIFTQVNLINTANATRNVQIYFLAENGIPITEPRDFQLKGGEQVVEQALDLFSLPPDILSVGSLKISADGVGIIGDVVFGDPESMNFAASLPLQNQPLQRLVFSQVADNSEFFTGLAFFNPNRDLANISIEVYTSLGALSGSSTINLGPSQRISRFLRELIPSTAGQVGGYIVVTSNIPIVGQELFGSQRSEFLSAVPPN